MKWVTVPGMKLKPYRCTACGGTPRDVEGNNVQAYFCEGVDVNWGDALYLCDSCVRVVGLLRGMVDVVEYERLQNLYSQLLEEHDELQQEHKVQRERIDRMLDGVKAKKEARETRQRRSSNKREPAGA